MRAGLLVLFTLVMAMAWSEASGQPHHARRASQRSAAIPGFRPAHEKLAERILGRIGPQHRPSSHRAR